MPRGVPIKPETRARIEALVREGNLSRNAIARETNVAGGVVTGIATDLGITFDHRQTELAVAAHSVDLAEARARIAKKLAIEVERAIDDMHTPTTHFQFEAGHPRYSAGDDSKIIGYSKGQFRELILPEPTISDKRNLMTIVGIGVTKIAELTKSAAAEGAPEAIAFVETLERGLNAVRAFIEPEGADSDPTVVPDATTREALLAEYSVDADIPQSEEIGRNE